MKLLRKINNNAAVAQDNRGREMVVLGRGVGFHPMPYELTDLSVVYRTFYDVDPQYYEMLASLPEEALLAAADITEQAEITLHTGRTHQIRVQFASRRHPLYGDGKYGSRQKGSIALQSCGLRFVHPDTGKPMAFSLPLPAAAPWKEFLELGE